MGVRSNRLPLRDPARGERFRVNLGTGNLGYKDLAGCRRRRGGVGRLSRTPVYRA